MNWLKHTEETFDFALRAKARFDDPETTLEEKKLSSRHSVGTTE
jgi:hypothetical protein